MVLMFKNITVFTVFSFVINADLVSFFQKILTEPQLSNSRMCLNRYICKLVAFSWRIYKQKICNVFSNEFQTILIALLLFFFFLLFSHLADAFIQSNLQIRKNN